MSAKTQTENERFILALLASGFSISTASIVLNNLSANQALIRIIGTDTNFTLSDRQTQTFQKALTDAGLSKELSSQVTESIQRVELKNPPKIPEIEGLTDSAFANALVSGGLSITFATILTNILNEDEKVVSLVSENKRPVMYMTQRDNKVDDIICLPLEGNVYAIDASNRVKIPSGTHPNCRCFYLDAVTGENLGQF